jgi:hypothetical protein
MSPPVRATAVKEGRRLVLVASKGDRNAKGMQVYLAESLGQWLGEQKVDGAGRPYGETKDEDPTLRKHFTRAQAALARTPLCRPFRAHLHAAPAVPAQNQAIQRFGRS